MKIIFYAISILIIIIAKGLMWEIIGITALIIIMKLNKKKKRFRKLNIREIRYGNRK